MKLSRVFTDDRLSAGYYLALTLVIAIVVLVGLALNALATGASFVWLGLFAFERSAILITDIVLGQWAVWLVLIKLTRAPEFTHRFILIMGGAAVGLVGYYYLSFGPHVPARVWPEALAIAFGNIGVAFVTYSIGHGIRRFIGFVRKRPYAG